MPVAGRWHAERASAARLPHQCELDQHIARLARRIVIRCAMDRINMAVGKEGGLELGGLFGIAIEPEARGYAAHGGFPHKNVYAGAPGWLCPRALAHQPTPTTAKCGVAASFKMRQRRNARALDGNVSGTHIRAYCAPNSLLSGENFRVFAANLDSLKLQTQRRVGRF